MSPRVFESLDSSSGILRRGGARGGGRERTAEVDEPLADRSCAGPPPLEHGSPREESRLIAIRGSFQRDRGQREGERVKMAAARVEIAALRVVCEYGCPAAAGVWSRVYIYVLRIDGGKLRIFRVVLENVLRGVSFYYYFLLLWDIEYKGVFNFLWMLDLLLGMFRDRI